jgi:hypothetical protein
MRTLSILLALVIVILTAPAVAQPGRVDPNARQILDYRLTLDRVQRVEAVMRVMDGTPDRGPEAPRADVAMIAVLTMAWAFGDPWRDTTADETVRTLDRGHAELTSALQGAGLSTRDYVLTTMSLLLAHTAATARRQGQATPVVDVAPQNVAWVEANWSFVDRLMRDLQQRMDAARRR